VPARHHAPADERSKAQIASGDWVPRHLATRTRIEPQPLSLCIQNDILRDVSQRAYGHDTPQHRVATAVGQAPRQRDL